MNELVSVIIPTYKRADTLTRSIDSVLNQSYQNIEIIVVDDNNPNSKERLETENAMNTYSYNKAVKYIKHEFNKNGAAARNTGFKKSNGKYIMFLDDDDEFLPDKVKFQVECLQEKDESWGACYTRYIRMRNGKVFLRSTEKREGNLLVEELKRNLFVAAGSNLMIRRSVVEELNGFNESFKRNQDQEFLSRLLLKYKLAYANIEGAIIHLHDNMNANSVDFDELTKQYLETFSDIISKLEKKDQMEIIRMINLQRLRKKLSESGKRIEALNMLRSKEVRLWDASLYFLHLLNRKITKTSYGFELKSRRM